jgi:hypothetical protein
MSLLLSILACVVALIAGVLSWRARRASLLLALEMIQLRDRLAAAERINREAAEAAQMQRTTAPPADAGLLSRVIALEGRLRDALAGRAAPGRDPGEDPRQHVRRELKRRGFHNISILGSADGGRYLVEAERSGVVSKGHAELVPDGTVHWHSLSSLRAFP